MESENPSLLRPLVWLGDSKKNIRGFPHSVQKIIGDELQFIQRGDMPKDAKPLTEIGPGVIEIALRHNKEAYRCVQALCVGEKIYVLHAFQKKSKRGISTPKGDIAIIKQRYREARELVQNEKADQN